MNVMVGTEKGLWDAEGTLQGFDGREITAVSGGWVLADGRSVMHDGVERASIDGPAATCLLARGDSALVGTAEAHLVAVGDGTSPLASFDDVAGRDAWYTPWGGPPDVRSLAAGADGELYVNVHVGGILRSTDGGGSWEPTLDIDLDVHQVVVGPGGVVLAACAHGVAVSNDHGATWTVEDDGLHATYARAVAVAGDTVLLSASTGPGGQRAAVYRRPMTGGRFERATAGLPEWFAGNVDTACLAAAGDTGALGTADGSVWVSQDAGTTWSLAATGLPTVRCLALDM